MKKIFLLGTIAIVVITGFIACDNPKGTPQELALRRERDSLMQVIDKNSQEIDAFLTSFVEIQNTLNTIKEKENIVTIRSTSPGEMAKEDTKESIQQDVRDIYQLLTSNKKKLEMMRKKLGESNQNVVILNEIVANLEAQVIDGEKNISDLKKSLENKNIQISGLEAVISALTSQLSGLESQLDQQIEKLNTAWYRLATKRALQDEGILERGKLTAENNDMFQKIDIRTFTEVPIYASSIKFLTTHPEDSYEIVKEGRQVEKIIIKDIDAFWSNQKRLVIQVRY